MCDSFFRDYPNSSLNNKNKLNMKLLQQLAMLWSEMCNFKWLDKLFILDSNQSTFFNNQYFTLTQTTFFCSLKKTMKLNVVKNKLIPFISIAFTSCMLLCPTLYFLMP